jgi:hypothetical protein
MGSNLILQSLLHWSTDMHRVASRRCLFATILNEFLRTYKGYVRGFGVIDKTNCVHCHGTYEDPFLPTIVDALAANMWT